MAYDFLGNVRELQSLILSASAISGGFPISLQNLPPLHTNKSVAVTRQIVDNDNLLLSHVEKIHIMSGYDLVAGIRPQQRRCGYRGKHASPQNEGIQY